MGIKALYGRLPKRASLVYLEDEGGKEMSYSPTEESLGVFQERLNGLVQGIMEEQFYPIPGYMECRFCDYGGDLSGEGEGGGGVITIDI